MSGNDALPACAPAFVKLCVPDMAEAERFYAEVFGLAAGKPYDSADFQQVSMTAPGNSFAVILQEWKVKPVREIGDGWGPLGLATDNLDVSLQRATAAGARITKGPVNAGAARFAIVETPQGHALEFIQYGQ